MIPAPEPALVRQYLAARGISARAIAARMGIHPGHLQRVLNGERPGSRALLRRVARAAEKMPGRRREDPDEAQRLIDAATHVFFLKRGDFESAICAGANRRKSKE